MSDLLLSFVPFFALVLLGWAAGRARLLPLEGLSTLNTFVLFFGLPALLFQLGAQGALRRGWEPALLWVYGVAGAFLVLLVLTLAWRRGHGRRDAGMLALAAVFPNTGFLGLPLLTGLLGPEAAGPVAATLLVDVLVMSTVCLAWGHSAVRKGGEVRGGIPGALAVALRGAVRNPLLWAMLAGALWGSSGLALPGPVAETVHMLSTAATPAALFTLGALLARAQKEAVRPALSRTAKNVPLVSLVTLKLVLHPALVGLVGVALAAVGHPLPTSGLLTLMMAAALPSASNVSMLAEREGADTGAVARLILWTTALALLTLTLWAHALALDAGP